MEKVIDLLREELKKLMSKKVLDNEMVLELVYAIRLLESHNSLTEK